IADMRKHGFEIVSVTEPDLCATDPTRVLMRQVLGAFAQYERTMIVAKLRAARNRRRATAGRCEGRKPYGSRPGEPETIDRMRELRAEGLTLRAVIDRLQAEALKPRG